MIPESYNSTSMAGAMINIAFVFTLALIFYLFAAGILYILWLPDIDAARFGALRSHGYDSDSLRGQISHAFYIAVHWIEQAARRERRPADSDWTDESQSEGKHVSYSSSSVSFR